MTVCFDVTDLSLNSLHEGDLQFQTPDEEMYDFFWYFVVNPSMDQMPTLLVLPTPSNTCTTCD